MAFKFALLALVALLGSVQCQFAGRDPRDETAPECAEKVMDIFFILDSSTSIYVNDYRMQQQFVRDVIARFDVGDRATRVGILTFSNDITRPVMDLDRYQEKNEVINSVNERNLPYRTGITNTHLAISFVRQNAVFRDDITKVIVIITDGGSRDQGATRREARLAREQGFYVFVVGIGQYIEEAEWNDMASDPDNSFVFNLTNFRTLDSIKNTLPSRACPLPPIILGGYCNVEEVSSLSYVSGPETSQDALFLISNFIERSDDPRAALRINYFLEACSSQQGRNHGDIYQFCDRFFQPDSSTIYTYEYLVNEAVNAARRDQRGNKAAVLFVGRDSALNRFQLEQTVNQLQQRNVRVIVVDLTQFAEAQFVAQGVLNDRDNYIPFNAQSVVDQRSARRSLIDQTCRAINNRSGGLPFVPV